MIYLMLLNWGGGGGLDLLIRNQWMCDSLTFCFLPCLFSPLQAPTTLLLPLFLVLPPPAWPTSTEPAAAMVTTAEEGEGSTMAWVWLASPRSTFPRRARPWAGRQPSMLRGKRRWWATPRQVEGRDLGQEGAGPSLQPAPRNGRDSTTLPNPRNKPRRQPRGRRGRCSVSRSRTPSEGPASASWSGSILSPTTVWWCRVSRVTADERFQTQSDRSRFRSKT